MGAPLAELAPLGWTRARTSAWGDHRAEALVPGRMVSEERGSVQVVTAAGGVAATISGHLRHAVETDAATL